MDVEAARFIGAGLAMLCCFGVGIGIGNIFSNWLSSISRNPDSESKLRTLGYIGFAGAEAIALLAFLIALIIIFVK